MKTFLGAVSFCLAAGICSAAPPENTLPPAAAQALRAPGRVVLYSLEPWDHPAAGEKTFHKVRILGRTELDGTRSAAAIAELEAAVAGWDGLRAACFDPRHALRVTAKGHTYDFLLCYDCHQLEVYRDNKDFASLGAAGSPQVLDELLSAAKVPLSWSARKIEAENKRLEEAEVRWRSAMPKSIAPVWDEAIWDQFSPNLQVLRDAIGKEFPDPRQRILALFAWFGSGAGPWSGFPSYEEVAEELLLDVPTPDLIAAAQTAGLSEPQLEGAARLFGGWAFGQRRPDDRRTLPADLKRKLLDHSLKSADGDKLRRARKAFAEP